MTFRCMLEAYPYRSNIFNEFKQLRIARQKPEILQPKFHLIPPDGKLMRSISQKQCAPASPAIENKERYAIHT